MAPRTTRIGALVAALLTLVFRQVFFFGVVHRNESEFTKSEGIPTDLPANDDVKSPTADMLASSPSVGASKDGEESMLRKPAHSTAQDEPAQRDAAEQRELTFSDLIMGDYISRGSVNIAVEVELPDWWHQQQNGQQHRQQGYFRVDENTKLVLKISTYLEEGIAEVRALRALNADKDLAAKHNILPLVWGAENFDNPYYEGGGVKPRMQVPEKWGKNKRALLCEEKTISALVVPNLDSLGQMHSFSGLKTLEQLRRFMRSFLSTLDYAHGLGVNNNDLSSSNVFYDDNGDAILMDWNAMRVSGQSVYDDEANFWIVPPEAMLEKVPVAAKDGRDEIVMKEVQHTKIGSFDVWSAGVMFVGKIFWPCEWISQFNFGGRKPEYWYLKAVMQSLGGNAKIRVNEEGEESDLAAMVGLDSNRVAQTSFRPPLCLKSTKPCEPCNGKRFPILDDAGEELKAKALDFTEKMMVLAPQDRPTAKELLDHPFLNYVEEE